MKTAMQTNGFFYLGVLLSLIIVSDAFIGYRYLEMIDKLEETHDEAAKQFLWWRNAKNGYGQKRVHTFFLEQPLDHFSAVSKRTFKQRYLVNEEYWRSRDHPVFLYICGEIRLPKRRIEIGEMAELGKKHGALLVGVEHRFYGASINEDGMQLEQLQYLSSQQALADVASLVRHLKDQYTIPESTPWLSFGGSYAGVLSAWFRLKYPHLVAGAVASSAPVQAQVNFDGYNRIVAADLNNTLVGGSPECLNAMVTAFRRVDAMIDEGKLDDLKADFKLCQSTTLSEEDAMLLVSDLASIVMTAVQHHSVDIQPNIHSICRTMTSSDSYKGLIQLNQDYLKHYEHKCLNSLYTSYLNLLKRTAVESRAWIRQWTYQTCAQFGYFPTCDDAASCPFSQRMTLNTYLDICQKVFKISPKDVDRNIQFTNDYYGGNQTEQSNIIFINGSLDPWHCLSVLEDQPASGRYSVFIPGTAHCADLHVPRPLDPPALEKARADIASLVKKVIEEAKTKKQ